MDADEDGDEENERVAGGVAQLHICHEVREEHHVIHEYEIGELAKDFHPVGEQVFHRVIVDQVIPHDLNWQECCCKLQPSEGWIENYRENEDGTS